MGDDDERRSGIPRKVCHHVDHPLCALAVEVARGFVSKHHGRRSGERPRHGHALALAAGQLVRPMVETPTEAHVLKQPARPGRRGCEP